MSTERKIIIALLLIILVAGALIARVAYDQHIALERADRDAAANAAAQHVLQEQIDERDAADREQQKASRQQQAAIQTGAEAVRVIRQIVQVPVPAGATSPTQPQQVVARAEEIPAAARDQLPASPEYTIQTQESAVATARTLLQCQADKQSLSACRQDKVDLQAQLASQKSETETWRQAAKGGSTAKRFWKVAKCAAFAGGGAAAGQVIGGQPRWVAVGAAAGAVGCHFVF